MYPDVAFSVLTSAFSHALFKNNKEVDILDVYNAIKSSKRIYQSQYPSKKTKNRRQKP